MIETSLQLNMNNYIETSLQLNMNNYIETSLQLNMIGKQYVLSMFTFTTLLRG